MVAVSTAEPKFRLNREEREWGQRLVVTAKNKVLDWTRILEDVTEKLGVKSTTALIPFNERKAILDAGKRAVGCEIIETQDRTMTIEKWLPSCNSLEISDGCFHLNLVGLPFNLWTRSIIEQIAMAMGGALCREH
uniref:DUF4283 domain-containing protein n=1 Tax=Nelumbo nucifera TaxID=4432 RepID=A0A822ZNK0_NELNU|nr:TPA_asm: hypothetical protein HUJ06_017511 [Nelumbo nucifera]